MLAHPPKAQVAEDGQSGARSGIGAVRLEHFGPDDVVAVEGGAAMGSLLVVDERISLGLKLARALLPGGIEVIPACAQHRSGDIQPHGAEVAEQRIARGGLGCAEHEGFAGIGGDLDDAADLFVSGGAIGEEAPFVFGAGEFDSAIASEELPEWNDALLFNFAGHADEAANLVRLE